MNYCSVHHRVWYRNQWEDKNDCLDKRDELTTIEIESTCDLCN